MGRAVKCILRWAAHRERPTCPQCKAPFDTVWTYLQLDGTLCDFPSEESVALLLRARWFCDHMQARTPLCWGRGTRVSWGISRSSERHQIPRASLDADRCGLVLLGSPPDGCAEGGRGAACQVRASDRLATWLRRRR